GQVAARHDVNGMSADVAGEIAANESGWILARAWSENGNEDVLDIHPYATTSPIYVTVRGRPHRSRPAATWALHWLDRLEKTTLARPRTTTCRTRLFTDVRFADFSPKSFAYAPPSACPGPLQNVVLEADWSVEPGRQFDRTANLWIGGVNVYFGTTAEPTRPPNAIGRSWHVERDITDYTAALLAPAAGRADLGNLVNDTYTSALWGTAEIAFYPFNGNGNDDRRSQVPDLVLPLSSSATGGTVALFSPSDALTATFQLPTNVERAFLDVVLQ